MPVLFSTERSAARSISSTAATGPPRRIEAAEQAVLTSGNIIRELALWGSSTTVS